MINSICVCGAGTMGSGIAQVMAQHGFKMVLFDLDQDVLKNAEKNIAKNLEYLILKEKISRSESQIILENIHFTSSIDLCKGDLIIEAIVEKADVKIALFNQLALLNPSTTILASNTSSLSISTLQQNIKLPERVAGLHFFNPAPLMKLVEVIKGTATSDEVINVLIDLCKKINKTPVVCNDAPGFIVNRVARHYYLESLKLVEDKIASFEDIDRVMESTGFKMGPFKLMDLIGMDINLSVSKQLYEASGYLKRFKPSIIQEQLVKNGKLGKKTMEGFYLYPNKKD